MLFFFFFYNRIKHRTIILQMSLQNNNFFLQMIFQDRETAKEPDDKEIFASLVKQNSFNSGACVTYLLDNFLHKFVKGNSKQSQMTEAQKTNLTLPPPLNMVETNVHPFNKAPVTSYLPTYNQNQDLGIAYPTQNQQLCWLQQQKAAVDPIFRIEKINNGQCNIHSNEDQQLYQTKNVPLTDVVPKNVPRSQLANIKKDALWKPLLRQFRRFVKR